MSKGCKDCGSVDLVPRGAAGFRNQCRPCWARTQRASWAANREKRLITSRANYARHAAKRREEAAAYKAEHREYYTLCEWFRRKGIPVSHIPPEELQALVEMKQTLGRAKAVVGRK